MSGGPGPMPEVLILGGTVLAAEAGVVPRLSLAGRTATPKNLPPDTRIGGFGGVDGLVAYLETHRIDMLIDATHPFAVTATPRLTLIRAPWQPDPGDSWQHVADEAEAASVLPGTARVFLALGAQRLAAFAKRVDVAFVIRVVDPPAAELLPVPHDVVVGRGPYHAKAEMQLFTARNSGGRGAVAKLEVARRLGVQVIMIARAAPPPGPSVATAQEARDWVMDQLS